MRSSSLPALVALALVACRGSGARSDEAPIKPVPTASTATPRPAPTVDEATWASWATPCKTDDECSGIGRCCACGSRDYRPVLKVHEAEAAKTVPPGDCECPQQHCNRIVFHCRAGTCAVEEN